MSERRFDAKLAWAVADGLLATLKPLCEPEHCVVAGSLRRGKDQVGDVEILYIPRPGMIQRPGEMFESEGSLADHAIDQLLFHKLHKRLSADGKTCWGQWNKLAVHRSTGLPVDFFATTRDRWYVSLVIRTGPKESNLRLIESARARGRQLHAYGVITELGTEADLVPQSEEEVFSLCGLPYQPPGER